MIRTALFALILSAAAAAPALAAEQHYRAEPANMPAQARFVARDVLWRCGDAGCGGAQTNSRPVIVCGTLAREIGPVNRFSAGGRALNETDLAKCNASARKIAPNEVQTAARRD